MQIFTGIDIGGSNVKFGLVDSTGKLLEKKKVPTAEIRATPSHAADRLVEVIGEWLEARPKVKHVGIGVPGMLSKNRRALVDLANIPELNGVKLLDRLERRFKKVQFHMENDANAAAIGELHFSGRPLPDNFMLITLGTGVGGAAIINRKVFKGGNGNAMEIGHIVSGNARSVEQNIGKAGLIQMALDKLRAGQNSSYLFENEKFDDDDLIDAALENDELAKQVFADTGRVLGQAMASAILLLDITTILIGGGVGKAFQFMEKTMHETLKEYLVPYYYDKLDIKLAKLGNNAGILGAAALCFKHSE